MMISIRVIISQSLIKSHRKHNVRILVSENVKESEKIYC